MTRVLAHPVSVDSAGNFATVEQGSPGHAAQVAGHVLACIQGERPLAPAYGLPDPVGVGVDESAIVAVLDDCEPDIEVDTVDVTANVDGSALVELEVTWAAVEPSLTIGADIP